MANCKNRFFLDIIKYKSNLLISMKWVFLSGVTGVILYTIGIILRGLFLVSCETYSNCPQTIEVTIFTIIAYIGAILAIGSMIIILSKKLKNLLTKNKEFKKNKEFFLKPKF